jgi:hypothetical protein
MLIEVPLNAATLFPFLRRHVVFSVKVSNVKKLGVAVKKDKAFLARENFLSKPKVQIEKIFIGG